MSFIHYLIVGRFARDDRGVRFARPGPGEPYRPVVASPLTPGDIAAAVGDASGTIPEGWSAWLDDGYLVCDLYTRNADEIEFVARLVEQTGCALHDHAGHADLSLADWFARTRGVPAASGR